MSRVGTEVVEFHLIVIFKATKGHDNSLFGSDIQSAFLVTYGYTQDVTVVVDNQFLRPGLIHHADIPVFNQALEKLPVNVANDQLGIQENLNGFQKRYNEKIQYWEEQIYKRIKKGQKIVIWGAGSKGVTFLNLISNGKEIEYAVDINPLKQGKYIAGSGQQIVAPEFLQTYQPDVIIIMNPIYANKIQEKTNYMEIFPEVITNKLSRIKEIKS